MLAYLFATMPKPRESKVIFTVFE